jgi:hypothetical protein
MPHTHDEHNLAGGRSAIFPRRCHSFLSIIEEARIRYRAIPIKGTDCRFNVRMREAWQQMGTERQIRSTLH